MVRLRRGWRLGLAVLAAALPRGSMLPPAAAAAPQVPRLSPAELAALDPLTPGVAQGLLGGDLTRLDGGTEPPAFTLADVEASVPMTPAGAGAQRIQYEYAMLTAPRPPFAPAIDAQDPAVAAGRALSLPVWLVAAEGVPLPPGPFPPGLSPVGEELQVFDATDGVEVLHLGWAPAGSPTMPQGGG